MSYEVLARKYRSRTFDEVVGQTVIATTLKNAVATGRVHHGYLFTGTRGVGKTSMARILAKALNCSAFEAPTPTPCLECESCRLIADGEDLDVEEIDAASNNSVENVRDLRTNTTYRPARSRFKVFIIDEVHMLSTSAFNALLKTLEEPPGHVKFILATTDTHKVPATIVSRCQRFDFRNIDPPTIAAQLVKILTAEGLSADDVVIRRVARLANGSMRDALSLMDQLLSWGGGRLTEEIVEQLLPVQHADFAFDLLEAVAGSDPARALRGVETAAGGGCTPERFCDALIEHIRAVMLVAVCGADTDLLDLAGDVRQRVIAQARSFDAPTLVYMIGLLEEVRQMVKRSAAPRPLLDAAVVRLALASSFTSIPELLRRIGPSEGGPVALPTAADSKKKADELSRVAEPARLSGRRELPPSQAPATQARSGAGDAPGAGAGAVRTAAPRRGVGGSAEVQRAMQDPLVRKALELSAGSLVEVRRTGSTGVAAPEPGNGSPGDAAADLPVDAENGV